jgi:hypothetical protein
VKAAKMVGLQVLVLAVGEQLAATTAAAVARMPGTHAGMQFADDVQHLQCLLPV